MKNSWQYNIAVLYTAVDKDNCLVLTDLIALIFTVRCNA